MQTLQPGRGCSRSEILQFNFTLVGPSECLGTIKVLCLK